MKISKRLEAIATMVPSAHTVIDVGCDHGLLGIFLLNSHKCKHIINVDISESAIKSAKKNVEKYKLEKATSFFASDGLKKIPYQKEDVIVIAGMGAHTIIDILKQETNLSKNLILSAHKDIPYLRKEMVKMGYKIIVEKAILDKLWYVIIHFQKGKANYSKLEYELGPFARYEKNYMHFIKKREERISNKRKKKTDMLLLLEKTYNKKV